MPKTLPLLTLPNTDFTQCSVRENIESISIYSTRQVEVTTRHGQKITIHPYDLSWPQFSSIGDFVAYLKVCHFNLHQFNNGDYQLVSLVKGLGGGIVMSSLRNLGRETVLFSLRQDILNEVQNEVAKCLFMAQEHLLRALTMNVNHANTNAHTLTNFSELASGQSNANDNISTSDQDNKSLIQYNKNLAQYHEHLALVRGNTIKTLSLALTLIQKQAKITAETLNEDVYKSDLINHLLDALIILDEVKNITSYRTLDASCSFRTLQLHLIQAKELVEKLDLFRRSLKNDVTPKIEIPNTFSQSENPTGSLEIAPSSGLGNTRQETRARSLSISGPSSSSAKSYDTEQPKKSSGNLQKSQPTVSVTQKNVSYEPTLLTLPVNELRILLNASLHLDLPKILGLAKPIIPDKNSLRSHLIEKLGFSEDSLAFALLMTMDSKTIFNGLGSVFAKTSITTGLIKSLWHREFAIDHFLGDWEPVKKAVNALQVYYSTFNQDGLDHQRLVLNLLKDQELLKFLIGEEDQNLRRHMVDICVATRVPGVDHVNMEKLFVVLTSLQEIVQSNPTIIRDYTSLCAYSLLDNNANTAELLIEVLPLLGHFEFIINAYLKPLMTPQDILSSPFIQQAFDESQSPAMTQAITKENEKYWINKNDKNYINFERLLIKIAIDGGERLAFMSTPTGNHLKAKQYCGLTFTQSKEESTEISVIQGSFQHLSFNGFGFTECVFENISFQHTFLENCHFEKSAFREQIQLDGMVIDFQTAHSLFHVLYQALSTNSAVFTGKILLIGDKPNNATDLTIPAILFHYIDSRTKVNWVLKTHTQFTPAFPQTQVQKPGNPDNPDSDEAATPQENISWLMGGISSITQSALNVYQTTSEKTASYLSNTAEYLGNIVGLSSAEYYQSVEEEEDEEIAAITRKMVELEKTIADIQQHIGGQDTEINELKTHQDALKQITANLKEKVAFKAKVHNFLEHHSAHPQVQAFYDTFLTQTSASFLALFLLQNSMGLIAAEPGTILDKTKQGNSQSNLLVSAENGINWTLKASGLLTIIAQNAPSLIQRAAAFLKNAATTLPIIGGIAAVAKIGIDKTIQVQEKRTLAYTDAYMSSLTPKVIEQIAYYLAFRTTFAYVNQIKLLTQQGAHTFAECGVNRLIIGLLNGEMNQYQQYGIGTAALATLRLSSVHQNRKKLFGIDIPWTRATLDALPGLTVTENQLYKYCGIFYRDPNNGAQQYTNKAQERDLSRKLDFMQISSQEFEIFRFNLISAMITENSQSELKSGETVLNYAERSDFAPLSSRADLIKKQDFDAMKKELDNVKSLLLALTRNVHTLNNLQFVGAVNQNTTDFHTTIITQIDTAVQSTPATFSPTVKQIPINRDISSQPITTLGDGNCAFNAIAIGLCQLVAQNPLFDKGLHLLNIQACIEKIPDWDTRQRTLAPLLRSIAINEIRKKETGSLYKARLWQAYSERSIEDDTFIIHPHIEKKFTEPNLTEENVNNWWDTEGKDKYFYYLSLSESVADVPDRVRWGSDIEIEFLALLFDINIKYITYSYSKTLGIGSGMISADFTEAEKERLSNFNLIETKINCWTLKACKTREVFEAEIARFAPLTIEEMEVLHSLLQAARQFPDDPKYNDLKQKLIRLGILNKYKEIFLFIDKDGAGTINVKAISNYAQGINDTLKAKLLDCYKENFPTFTLQYSGTHWEYRGT